MGAAAEGDEPAQTTAEADAAGVQAQAQEAVGADNESQPREALTLGQTAPRDSAHTEVRFGLVLYGGVSLAIYIYGVVLEFWRLMEASEKGKHPRWRALLDEAGVTAAVDVVSGTSAGGINGVLLGKAVACGSDLSKVQHIWVDGAEIGDLLQAQDVKEPGSLLRTDKFEHLLDQGLKALDSSASDSRPLGRVFDLFVSATRLNGRERAFPTDLQGTIQTRQYRERFHFKLRSRGYIRGEEQLGDARNDFTASHNRRLADAARSTSAFPGAFEPKAVKGPITSPLPGDAGAESDAEAFLVDGGVLHNKPFTESVDTIVSRASDSRVERWLVSVEPDPEGRGEPPPAGPPLMDEIISKSLVGIPRYQSIASDLERLEAHRKYVKRQNELLASLDQQFKAIDEAAPEGGLRAPGAESVQRAAQLSADLAANIAALTGLSEVAEQALEGGFRRAIAAERLSDDADFSFEKRRVYFLIKRLTAGLKPKQPAPDAVRALLRDLWAEYDRVSLALWDALTSAEAASLLAGLDELVGQEQFDDAAQALARKLDSDLKGSLADVRENTARICTQLDNARLVPRGSASATLAFSKYAHWDAYLLPVDPLMGLSRDTIRLARISPEDADFIGTSAANKLAGDSLAHFGGFLKREWRLNDILWGRLDAAEQIVRMVGANLSKSDQDKHVKAIQADIVKDMLKVEPASYQRYLDPPTTTEPGHRVGSEGLLDIGVRKLVTLTVDSAGIARRLMTTLETGHASSPALGGIYHYIGIVMGWVLAALRWPVETIWGQQKLSTRGVSFAVLAASAWSVVSIVLAAFEQISLHVGGYVATGVGIVAFLVWTIVMAKARGNRPPDGERGTAVTVEQRPPPGPAPQSEPAKQAVGDTPPAPSTPKEP